MIRLGLRQPSKGRLLLRRSKPLYRIQCRLRNTARFFAPNEADAETDISTGIIKSEDFEAGNFLPLTKKPFLDPNSFYPEVEITDSTILDAVLQITYEPVKSWSEICTTNMTCTAQIGSFIEFIHDDEIQFGVVLREPHTRFNPYHNRMIVLTLHNELVKVYPQDITFSMHRVLDEESISPHYVLTNRFNETYAPRAKLVQVLHQFMALVAEMRTSTSQYLEAAHSNLASDDKVSPVCLSDLAKFTQALDQTPLPSYFHQSAFLMALRMDMCSDASRWIVPGCVSTERVTNLSISKSSNTVPPPPVMFATPVAVFTDVQSFMQYSDAQMSEFNKLLKALIDSPMNYDDLVLQFEIWEAKRFRSGLKAMMYAVVYPHPQILHKLSQMSILGPSAPSSESIFSFLKKIGLYDNPQNPLTDPLMSAGLLGKVRRNILIASSSKDLETSTLHHSASVEANKNKFVDKFTHLRKSRSFFYDTTAYILPGLQSNMAISMEEINSRRFLINVHVADVASRLSPSSNTFAKWSASNAFLENSFNIADLDKTSLLPHEATRNMFFNKTRPKPHKDYFMVGDHSSERAYTSNSETQTCMTITFEYNSYLDDPMTSLSDTVRISFDELHGFQFKKFDESLLEKSLTGKLEPSLLGKLKLFKHKESKTTTEETVLDPDDHYHLNFLYNVLRRHFEARNRSYAVNLKQGSRPRDVKKTIIASEDSDMITSNVSLVQETIKHEKIEFFVSETKILAGRLVSEFAARNNIPVFYESKELLDQEEAGTVNDEVLIKHNNMLLPDFSASSYSQIPYGRDVSGHLSTPAFLFACNFVGLSMVNTNAATENAPLGLRKGLVNVVDATESMKAYINQLQLLQHVHFTHTANNQLYKNAHKFSHLRSLGYSLHGALSKATIDAYSAKIMACSIGSEYFAARQRRYWVLKAVEQNPQEFCELRCVITHISRDIDMFSGNEDLEDSISSKGPEGILLSHSHAQTVRAYCEELGMEVDLVIGCESGVMVGSEKTAAGIVHANAATGEIVLGSD
ncbi:hypothetical protein OXX79_011133 [Metschnikowia pulcherrima]